MIFISNILLIQENCESKHNILKIELHIK